MTKPEKKKFNNLLLIIALMIVSGIYLTFPNTAHAADAADTSPVFYSDKTISIKKKTHAPRKKLSTKPFKKIKGKTLGLDRIDDFWMFDFIPPFYNGRGIAAGDFDNDWYQDIVIARKGGVILYRNQEGKRFTEVPTNVTFPYDLHVIIVALVDMDGDGWLDLYLTTFNRGNFLYLNDKGNFTASSPIKLPNSDAIYTNAAAFADIDLDGDMDITQGNFHHGFLTIRPGIRSSNVLVLNQGKATFTQQDLFEPIVGETQAIFLSDINKDGFQDLMIGNDFEPPDYFYLGKAGGAFEKISKKSGVIPVSTKTTMSFDSADINNDLLPDIYIAQITGEFGKGESVKRRRFSSYCNNISDNESRRACRDNISLKDILSLIKTSPGNIAACSKINSSKDQQKNCMIMAMMILSMRGEKPELCKKIPDTHPAQQEQCRIFHEELEKKKKLFAKEGYEEEYQKILSSEIHQTENDNVMLVAGQDGKFTDRAGEMDVDVAGWCWNAKFADLDNDEYQDLYVGNGTWFGDTMPQSNVFFHNQEGRSFKQSEEEFGLDDYMITPAYVYLDIENDGDIDIITLPVNGPVTVYKNSNTVGNSITFALNDEKGNSFGVGARVFIYYGDDGELAQMREVKAGGGFHSFDPPIVHFGLGSHIEVNRIKITWPTGRDTIIKKGFKANTHYTIKRL